MEINRAKFEQVIKEAKAKTNDPKWIRAIERAAEGILSGELIVTTLAHGALVTSPNGSYMANGSCQCKAFQRGHKECRHRAAARLIELYEVATLATSPAAERAGLIVNIKATWSRVCPHLPLATELLARFGKSKLEMLDDDMLRRVQLAIAM
jgi:hypothetical protein